MAVTDHGRCGSKPQFSDLAGFDGPPLVVPHIGVHSRSGSAHCVESLLVVGVEGSGQADPPRLGGGVTVGIGSSELSPGSGDQVGWGGPTAHHDRLDAVKVVVVEGRVVQHEGHLGGHTGDRGNAEAVDKV